MTRKQIENLKLNRYDKIQIDWFDSSSEDGWIDSDKCMEEIDTTVSSMGYFIGLVHTVNGSCLRFTRGYTYCQVDTLHDIPFCIISNIGLLK